MGRATIGLLTGLLLAGLTGLSFAATPCPPGSFHPLVVPVEGSPPAPLFPPDSATGSFVLGSDSVSIGACGTTSAHIRAARHYTFIRRVVWDDCPGFGRVRFQGLTNYPPCKALVGVLRWHDQTTGRHRALKFESLRIDE